MADGGKGDDRSGRKGSSRGGSNRQSGSQGRSGASRGSTGDRRSGSGGKTGRSGAAAGRSRGSGSGGKDAGRRTPTDSGHKQRSQRSSGSTGTRRRDLEGAAANLPNWVVEALARVTPANRVAPALKALGEASEALADGAFQRAVRRAESAKELAPRDSTVREVLGLAAYRSGDWRKALTELRAFRRMAGETTHLPVEMDALRAMGRRGDVEGAWRTLIERGGKPGVLKEGAVVYASHLIDEGDLDGAWEIVRPRGKDRRRPFPEDLRLWYVAARVAALRGDTDTAVELRNSILQDDPAFPGIDELESLITRA